MIKKRVIIIDDEPLIPSLIEELMEEADDLEVAHVSTAKDDFLKAVEQDVYDVALIDISIGEREGGLSILRTLKQKNINLPSIILSAHDELTYAPKCLEAGARGYINKSCICNDLIEGIRQVLAFKMFVSGDDGHYILQEHARLHP